MTDVAHIVERLSRAPRQRAFVLRLAPEGTSTLGVRWRVLQPLREMQLCFGRPFPIAPDRVEYREVPTPLGLAVRTAILSREGESADA